MKRKGSLRRAGNKRICSGAPCGGPFCYGTYAAVPGSLTTVGSDQCSEGLRLSRSLMRKGQKSVATSPAIKALEAP